MVKHVVVYQSLCCMENVWYFRIYERTKSVVDEWII